MSSYREDIWLFTPTFEWRGMRGESTMCAAVWQQGLQRLEKQKWKKYTIKFTEYARIEAESRQVIYTGGEMNQSGV